MHTYMTYDETQVYIITHVSWQRIIHCRCCNLVGTTIPDMRSNPLTFFSCLLERNRKIFGKEIMLKYLSLRNRRLTNTVMEASVYVTVSYMRHNLQLFRIYQHYILELWTFRSNIIVRALYTILWGRVKFFKNTL